MLVLKKLCEPNGIYGKLEESKFEIQFYSNKLNNSSNEYSLDKYKISIKNKDIKKIIILLKRAYKLLMKFYKKENI